MLLIIDMKRTKYSQKRCFLNVFAKAKSIKNKDPKKYRQDPYGNIMYLSSYGKYSLMGWSIDHIQPRAIGGSDDIRNLQALNSKINASKGKTSVKKSRHSKCNQ